MSRSAAAILLLTFFLLILGVVFMQVKVMPVYLALYEGSGLRVMTLTGFSFSLFNNFGFVLIPTLTAAACFGAIKCFKGVAHGPLLLSVALLLTTLWLLATAFIAVDAAIQLPSTLAKPTAATPAK